MGYRDSLNLYQGMGMNGFNFVDPFGEAIINIFLGYKDTFANAMTPGSEQNIGRYNIKVKSKLVRDAETNRLRYKFPNWENLKILAGNRHTINIRRIGDRSNLIQPSGRPQYSRTEFINSVRYGGNETWTFYIGHSFGRGGTRFTGRGIAFNKENETFIKRSRPTQNKYVGIIGCDSSNYAGRMFPTARNLFSIKDSPDKEGFTKLQNEAWAAYALLSHLVQEGNENDIKGALKKANSGNGLKYVSVPRDINDKVIYENKLLDFARLFLRIF